jgi:hypothetical protein
VRSGPTSRFVGNPCTRNLDDDIACGRVNRFDSDVTVADLENEVFVLRHTGFEWWPVSVDLPISVPVQADRGIARIYETAL